MRIVLVLYCTIALMFILYTVMNNCNRAKCMEYVEKNGKFNAVIRAAFWIADAAFYTYAIYVLTTGMHV